MVKINKIDFSNEAQFKALKRQAYDGTISIDNFPAPEYRYFDRLRIIYARFRFDTLPKETAEYLEQLIYSEYKKDIEVISSRAKVYSEYQENIRKCNVLRTDIERSTDPVDIACAACKVIEVMTGEVGFTHRQVKKIL